MSVSPGDTLDDRYEVLSVHPGAMGVVYALRILETGEIVAGKAVREELRGDPRVRMRFEREVRTWIRLGRHPHLVQALSVESIEGFPLLMLEYVSGPTLATLLKADGPLAIAQAADFALQFARGLAFAHEFPEGGLVHRDVKPENLFVTRDRVAKVSDLGIVKVMTRDMEATAEGIGLGTPYYVSPEQLKGRRDVDGRSDVYSFGAVLYEMVTGEIPLHGDSLESQIYKILRTSPGPAFALNSAVPATLSGLIDRCLAKDPRERPTGFHAIAEELRELLEDPAFVEAEPIGATCGICGYASARTPEPCPVCGGGMGAPLPFRARAFEIEHGERAAGPASLSIRGVACRPRQPRVGQEVEIAVSVVNRGGAAARLCEMAYGTPDPDRFRLAGSDDAWHGEIPPTRGGPPLTVRYRMVPLREGSFAIPTPEIRYEGAHGERAVAKGAGPVRISVNFPYELPLAGREEPRKRLKSLLTDKTAAFALVEGEAGSGKSRFLSDAAEWLRETCWTVLRGKSLERGREPMKSFHDVARQAFGIGRGDLGTSSLMARVIDGLHPLVGEDPGMAGYFASFLAGGEIPEAQARMRDYLWFRLLAALSPVALLLDDLQWADEETLDLAESLVRRAREEGIAIAVAGSTLNADPGERTRRRIAHLKNRFSAMATNPGMTRRIPLLPLGEEDVRTLLDHVFPGNTLGEDHPWLLSTVTEQSGGNFFHLAQILKLLREAKDEEGEPLVSAEGGTWTLRPELSLDRLQQWVPPAVDDMVRALVTPLPEEVRSVLDMAAAIGEEFEASLLEEIAGDVGKVDRALEELEQAELVRATDDAGGRLRFTSSLVPAIVERLTAERSRRGHARLHREVARAMEATLGRHGLRRSAMRYARHLLLAGDRELAFRWLVAAADGFVRQQHFFRAETALNRAARLLAEGVEAPDHDIGTCRLLQGEVLRVTGRLGEALEAYEQAVEHLGTEEKGKPFLARVLGSMGRVHEIRGETDRAVYCFELGARIREDLGDALGIAYSLNDMGRMHLMVGEEEKAVAAFSRARDIARESDRPSALGKSLDNLATVAIRRGAWEDAEALFRESMAIAEKSGNRLGVARSLNGLGTVAIRTGDLEKAKDRYQRAIRIRQEVGDREGAANVLSNLGVIHDRLGDTEEALRYYRRAAEAHRAIGSRRGLATVLNNIGVVNLARGDVGLATERFGETLRIRREIGDRERMGRALLNMGEARALAGDRESAHDFLEEALSAFLGVEDGIGVLSVRAARAGQARREGRYEDALEDLRVALADEGRDTAVRALLHLETAEVLLAMGRIEGSAPAAERGFELAEEAGERSLMAQALRLTARLLRERGDTETARGRLRTAEGLLRGTSGPELARVYLEEALAAEGAERRELLMRARGLVDGLEARGVELPERQLIERLLSR